MSIHRVALRRREARSRREIVGTRIQDRSAGITHRSGRGRRGGDVVRHRGCIRRARRRALGHGNCRFRRAQPRSEALENRKTVLDAHPEDLENRKAAARHPPGGSRQPKSGCSPPVWRISSTEKRSSTPVWRISSTEKRLLDTRLEDLENRKGLLDTRLEDLEHRKTAARHPSGGSRAPKNGCSTPVWRISSTEKRSSTRLPRHWSTDDRFSNCSDLCHAGSRAVGYVALPRFPLVRRERALAFASPPYRQSGMAVGRGPAQGGRPRLIPSTAISRHPALPSGSAIAATSPKSLGRGHYSRLHREPADTPTGPRTTAVPPPVPPSVAVRSALPAAVASAAVVRGQWLASSE